MRESCAILPVDFGFDSKAILGRDILAVDPKSGETRFRHDFRVPSAIATPWASTVQEGATAHCAISARFAAKSWCWDDIIRASTVVDRSISREADRGAPVRHASARGDAARPRQDAPPVRLRGYGRRAGQRR